MNKKKIYVHFLWLSKVNFDAIASVHVFHLFVLYFLFNYLSLRTYLNFCTLLTLRRTSSQLNEQ